VLLSTDLRLKIDSHLYLKVENLEVGVIPSGSLQSNSAINKSPETITYHRLHNNRIYI